MFQGLGATPAGAPHFFTRCLVDHQGLLWQELDLQILAAQPEFLAIAA
jgi:twitching motility protein PilI